MAEGKSKAIRIFEIIFLLVILALIYLNYNSYQNKNFHAEEYNELLKSEENLKKEINIQEEKIKELNAELDSYSDMKERIAESKEEYFKNILLLEEKILNDESDVKIAYLTFDDGPYLTTTPDFLDILDEYDIKATFFYLLKDEDYDGLYRRVIDSGHTLANHSASHNLRPEGYIYSSVDRFMNDIMLNHDEILRRFDYDSNVMRFPGGSPQAGGLKGAIVERLKEVPYGYVDWDVTTGDGTNSGSVEEYIHNVLDNSEAYDLMVVLMHDYSYNTITALPTIIEGLKDQGFIFLPLCYESHKVIK